MGTKGHVGGNAGVARLEILEARRLLSADLTATIVSTVPAALSPVGNTISVQISNVGDAPAVGANVATTLVFNNVANPLTTYLTPAHSARAINISPGKSITFTLKFDVPTTLANGLYSLSVEADYTNVIPESDELNNFSDPVAVYVTPPFYDLSGQFGTVTSKTIKFGKAGGGYAASFLLTNNGNVTLKGNSGIRFFLSTDAIMGNQDDIDAGTMLFHGLSIGANKTKTIHLRLKLDKNLADGAYYLIAVIDPDNLVTESDEINNTAVSATVLNVVDTGLPPARVQVSLDASEITDKQAAPVDIGSALQNLQGPTKTFTITNVGTKSLILGGISAPPGFELIDEPMSSLDPGLSDTFTVQLDTNATGVPSGAVSFATNDPKHATFRFNVDGTVTVPQTPTLDSQLSVDTSTLVAGQPDEIVFTAAVAGTNANVEVEVDQTDANGTILNKVVDLFDDGSLLHADGSAGDGLFNNSTAITFDSPGDRFYIARFTDGPQATAVVKVSGVAAPTSQQLQDSRDNDDAQKQRSIADIVAGKTDSQIIANIKESLEGRPDLAVASSISISASAIGWTSPQGLRSIIDVEQLRDDLAAPQIAPASAKVIAPKASMTSDCGCGGTSTATASTTSAMAAADVTLQQCKQATILAPYAWRKASSASNWISGLSAKGWNPIVHQNTSKSMQDVTLSDFEGLSSSKAIVIASDVVVDGGTMWLMTGQQASITTDLARFGDFISGRLMDINGVYAISRRFIGHYGANFKDAIVYMEGNNTAFNDQLATPFISRGAAAYLGYTKDIAFPHLFGTLAAATLSAGKMVSDIPRVNEDVDAITHARFVSIGSEDAKLKDKCNLLSHEQVIVQYSWDQGKDDLDTGTTFLDGTVGFDAPDPAATKPFLTWSSGDNTGSGGSETANADVGGAFVAARWADSVSISCAAGWYRLAGGSGPAVITVTLLDTSTNEEIQTLTKQINPGIQDTLATTLVATVVVTASNSTDDATGSIAWG